MTSPGVVLSWLLGALRVGGFLFVLPVLGGPRVPLPASLALALSVASTTGRAPAVADLPAFGVLAAKEVAVGVLLGWGVASAFAAVQVGAQVAEVTLGLGTGHLVDPVHGHESTVLAQLWSTVALVAYLATDAHHHALRLVAASFAELPASQSPPLSRVAELGMELFARGFLAGVQLAAPLVVAAVAVEAGIALAARAAPQVNVFLVSLPLKVGLALVLVGLVLPHTAAGVEAVWSRTLRELSTWLRGAP